MKSLTLKSKIYVLLGLLIGGLVLVTALTLRELTLTSHRDATFAANRLELQDRSRVMQLTFKKQVQAWKDILLRGSDPESLKKYESEFLGLDASIQAQAEAVKKCADESPVKSEVDSFVAAHSELTTQYKAALQAFKRSRGRDFRAADAAVKGKDRPVTDAVDKLVEDVNADTQRLQHDHQVEAEQHVRWVAIGVTCFTAVLFLIGLYIVRSIANTTRRLIEHLSHQAQDMRAGKADLTKVIRATNDEFGEIAGAFDTFTAAARDIVSRLAKHSEQLASASEELSSGAGQSAETARLQSDQTHQVATAMQEMSATVQQISENSEKAADASRNAAQAARRGGEVAEETLSTMRSIADSTKAVAGRIAELGKSSEEIGKIVGVIDDIADQTNLLALNAAIEAARAGEQGRGFAVVADEVRKLAERTTKATKEIAAMIESIQVETKSAVQAMDRGSSDVQVGVEKTTASGAALQKIIRHSEEVGDMIAQIATAATQQSSASEQINSSVSQISSATAESSATANEMAKACQDVSSLAFELQEIVSGFRVDVKPHSAQQTAPAGKNEPGMGEGKHRAAAAVAGR